MALMGGGGGGGGWWLIHIRVWMGGQWWVLSHSFFLTCAFVFCSLMFIEHDSCFVCFFVYYLFSLFLVPLTKSYWGLEIVVPVM